MARFGSAVRTRTATTVFALPVWWGARSLEAFHKYSAPGQAVFGIVQGGVYEALRRQSAEVLCEMKGARIGAGA